MSRYTALAVASQIPANLIFCSVFMFLTPEELVELTGKRQAAAQVRALRFMGLEHRIRPDGSVAVLTEHVLNEMGVKASKHKKEKEWVPKWQRGGT